MAREAFSVWSMEAIQPGVVALRKLKQEVCEF